MLDPCRIVTLTTDFGTRDTFAGQVAGAVLAVAPEARVIDLTHRVPPHDVLAGAFLLETGVGAFPAGTVHVAVVDPGVGTDRGAVAVATERAFYVGPDNGVLTRALRHESIVAVHRIANSDRRRGGGGPTFDGRDLFGPAAGRIASGTTLDRIGPRVPDLAVWLPAPPDRLGGKPVEVLVPWIDRFGNVTLDLPAAALATAPGPVRIVAPRGVVNHRVRTYEEGGERPFLLVNSAGYAEIAVREGRADDALGLTAGATVRVEPISR